MSIKYRYEYEVRTHLDKISGREKTLHNRLK